MPTNTNPPVVFLDIDGPLLPVRMWYAPENLEICRRCPGNLWKDRESLQMIRFDPVGVHFVQSLVDLSGAVVVVSSTWTDHLTQEELQEIFHSNGLNLQFHNDWRTTHRGLYREARINEIASWMYDHPGVSQFLIIDDDYTTRIKSIQADCRPIEIGIRHYAEHVLEVDEDVGLTVANFHKGMEILSISKRQYFDYVNLP